MVYGGHGAKGLAHAMTNDTAVVLRHTGGRNYRQPAAFWLGRYGTQRFIGRHNAARSLAVLDMLDEGGSVSRGQSEPW